MFISAIIVSICLLIPFKEEFTLLFDDTNSFIISLLNILPHLGHISSFSYLSTNIHILLSLVNSWNVFSRFNLPPPYKNTN